MNLARTWRLPGAADRGAARGIATLLLQGNGSLKARILLIYGVITVIHLVAWLSALLVFADKPALLGLAMLVYGLGLRHAVDADHIAAIDNVTRKLMQENKRPVAVGFWFAIGHSAVVVFVTAAVVGATHLLGRFHSFQGIGGAISAGCSAIFLFAIAGMNLLIFLSVFRSFRRFRAGNPLVEEDLDFLLDQRGILARIFRPLFRLVRKSWHMCLLGLLFGLGFDTATEIAVFSISAEQGTRGLSPACIAIFPALFAAGMLLIDTTDGVMMLGAYDWAFVKPIRKIYYNMTITLVSAVVAIFIGGLEALGLLDELMGLKGGAWQVVDRLNSNFNNLGFAIVGLFVVAWVLSWLIYRVKRIDEFEAKPASASAK